RAAPDDAGEPQKLLLRRVRQLVDGRAPRELREQRERLPRLRAAANQHQPDAVQVRILLGGSCRQELLADHALDVLGPPPLARDSARDALREVRLAAGPYVDPLEYRAPDAQVVAEAGRERQALLEREIGGLDREPVDERREGRI